MEGSPRLTFDSFLSLAAWQRMSRQLITVAPIAAYKLDLTPHRHVRRLRFAISIDATKLLMVGEGGAFLERNSISGHLNRVAPTASPLVSIRSSRSSYRRR